MASFKVDLEQLEMQLEQWRERLEALVQRTGEIGPRDRVSFGQRVATLQAKHRVASTTINVLGDTDDDQDRNTDSSWNALESAFFKSN